MSQGLSRLVGIALLGAVLHGAEPASFERQRGLPTTVPERSPTLRVLDIPSGGSRRLALVDDGRELGSIAVPAGIAIAALEAGMKSALRHPNGRDVAVGFQGTTGSFVVVFLEGPTGAYVAVDVSQVERVNIGALGPFRTYRDRRTGPVEWLPLSRIEALGSRYHGVAAIQIRLQTEVWDEAGRRYVMAEPLIMTRDGTPLWR